MSNPENKKNLPTEVILDVIPYMDQSSLSRLSRCSKSYHSLLTPKLYARPQLTTARSYSAFLESISRKGSDPRKLVKEICLDNLAGRWEFVGDADIFQMVYSCPNVTEVSLDYCSLLTDTIVPQICKWKLTKLCLSRCPEITDEFFPMIATLKDLRVFEVSLLPRVSDDGLIPIAESCTLLETVNVSGTHISDDTIDALLNNCPKLECVDVSCCYGLLDYDTDHFEEIAPSIQWITDSVKAEDVDWNDSDEWEDSDLDPDLDADFYNYLDIDDDFSDFADDIYEDEFYEDEFDPQDF